MVHTARMWPWSSLDLLSRWGARKHRAYARAQTRTFEAAFEAVAERGANRPVEVLEAELDQELSARGESWSSEELRVLAEVLSNRARMDPEELRRARAGAAAHNERVERDDKRLQRLLRHRGLGDCKLLASESDDADRVLYVEHWSPGLANKLERRALPTRLVVRPLKPVRDGFDGIVDALHQWVDPVVEAAGFAWSGATEAPEGTVRVVYQADPGVFARRCPGTGSLGSHGDRWPLARVALWLTFDRGEQAERRVNIDLEGVDVQQRLRDLDFGWLATALTELSGDPAEDAPLIGTALALVLDVPGPDTSGT